jgi:hypothetical protein
VQWVRGCCPNDPKSLHGWPPVGICSGRPSVINKDEKSVIVLQTINYSNVCHISSERRQTPCAAAGKRCDCLYGNFISTCSVKTRCFLAQLTRFACVQSTHAGVMPSWLDCIAGLLKLRSRPVGRAEASRPESWSLKHTLLCVIGRYRCRIETFQRHDCKDSTLCVSGV